MLSLSETSPSMPIRFDIYFGEAVYSAPIDGFGNYSSFGGDVRFGDPTQASIFGIESGPPRVGTSLSLVAPADCPSRSHTPPGL